MKIQIDLNDELNKKLKLYKVIKGHPSLQDAAKEILERGIDFNFIELTARQLSKYLRSNQKAKTGG